MSRAQPAGAYVPRRLELDVDELAWLARSAHTDLPLDELLLDPPHDGDVTESLVARGLAGESSGIHPSLAANLGALARPQVSLTSWVRRGDSAVIARHGVVGMFTGGLVRVGADRVELSALLTVDLAAELARLISSVGVGQLAAASDRDVQQLDLAAELEGSVFVRIEARTAPHAELRRIGQVLWVWAGGWFGLRPPLDGDAGRATRLEAVAPNDIGTWIAPFLAVAVDGGVLV